MAFVWNWSTLFNSYRFVSIFCMIFPKNDSHLKGISVYIRSSSVSLKKREKLLNLLFQWDFPVLRLILFGACLIAVAISEQHPSVSTSHSSRCWWESGGTRMQPICSSTMVRIWLRKTKNDRTSEQVTYTKVLQGFCFVFSNYDNCHLFFWGGAIIIFYHPTGSPTKTIVSQERQ